MSMCTHVLPPDGGLGNVETLIQCDVIEDDGMATTTTPSKEKVSTSGAAGFACRRGLCLFFPVGEFLVNNDRRTMLRY